MRIIAHGYLLLHRQNELWFLDLISLNCPMKIPNNLEVYKRETEIETSCIVFFFIFSTYFQDLHLAHIHYAAC